MDPPGVKRRLTCILAADAVGYSRHVSEGEDIALRILAAHRAVIDGIIAFHDGRIVNTAGDSVLAEFHSVVEAVRCAVEIQDALKTRNESLSDGQRMQFRIGINLGDVVVKGEDLLGDGVNVASRLEGLAEPGGILIASSVYDQITGKLDLGFQDMGEQTLKNISRPIRAFRVSGAGGTIQTPGPRAGNATTRNRAVPIAIGVIALVSIAGGVAWLQGWIGGSRPAEVRVAAPDPARAKLEAELAASEKARAQAEQRATTADAEAISARAGAEAAALRAKAETEAVAMKAKAQADGAAIRSKAAQEASTAKAALEASTAKAAQEASAAKAAAASAASPAAPAASADASRHDGVWATTVQCSALRTSAPFTRSGDFVVRGGEFVIERGVAGQPGYNITRGRPAADGTLVMTGSGISPLSFAYGRPFDTRFEGRWTGDRFKLSGRYGERACQMEIARK